MNRKIRTAIAVIAGFAALSSIGVTSVASAAAVRPPADTVTVEPRPGVAESVNTGEYWTTAQAWHVGGGPGGSDWDDECQGYADQIMDAYAELLLNQFLGNAGGAFSNELQMEGLEDQATSEGCVVVYT